MRHKRKYWTEVIKRRVAAEQGWRCDLCQQLLGPVWAADHRIPLRQGGTNAIANCSILHPECHAQKTQDETLRAADQRRENKTGQSKYWDPQSLAFMVPLTRPVPRFCANLVSPINENQGQ